MAAGCLASPSLQRYIPSEALGSSSMKYGIDYRILKKGAEQPVDNTTMAHPVDVEVDDNQFALVPAVGDYVEMDTIVEDMRNIPFRGRVKSRLFNYVLSYCYVTIVVEETDEDWSKIKP
jgi:hypothetical protein